MCSVTEKRAAKHLGFGFGYLFTNTKRFCFNQTFSVFWYSNQCFQCTYVFSPIQIQIARFCYSELNFCHFQCIISTDTFLWIHDTLSHQKKRFWLLFLESCIIPSFSIFNVKFLKLYILLNAFTKRIKFSSRLCTMGMNECFIKLHVEIL